MTLKINDLNISIGQRVTVGSAPEGYQSYLLAGLVQRHDCAVLHVARDDRQMDTIAQAVRFFAPEIEILTFPAWDCLPYDRVSPNPLVASERMDTLGRLVRANASERRLVVTTVNAMLQRVVPRDFIARSVWHLAVGDSINIEAFGRGLSDSGYVRTGTVIEPGEYSVRGGLIDIFPPGGAEPARLDLFGDVIESIRTFDPTSQRTTGKIDKLTLRPVGEVPLDTVSVERFRAGYTALFGVPSKNDVLYAAASEGRRHNGIEHWLPLFHESLETLLDYLPDAIVTLDHMVEEARDARLEMIAEYHAARRDREHASSDDAIVYRPLEPERLYGTAKPSGISRSASARWLRFPRSPRLNPRMRSMSALARAAPSQPNVPVRPAVCSMLFTPTWSHSATRAVGFCSPPIAKGRRIVWPSFWANMVSKI